MTHPYYHSRLPSSVIPQLPSFTKKLWLMNKVPSFHLLVPSVLTLVRRLVVLPRISVLSKKKPPKRMSGGALLILLSVNVSSWSTVNVLSITWTLVLVSTSLTVLPVGTPNTVRRSVSSLLVLITSCLCVTCWFVLLRKNSKTLALPTSPFSTQVNSLLTVTPLAWHLLPLSLSTSSVTKWSFLVLNMLVKWRRV